MRALRKLTVAVLVCELLLGCSQSHTYRDDRNRVREQVAHLGRSLMLGHYISAVPPARVGACTSSHYAPVQWSAPLVGSIAAASDYDRSRAVVNAAGVVDLGRKYYLTTPTPDHNDSAAIAFTTSDRATQLTVTVPGSQVRVDGFASC